MVSVTNASYANCNGLYEYQQNLSVDWAPLKPVYKHLTKDRYIFWSQYYTWQWHIGAEEALSAGGGFYLSKCMKSHNNLQYYHKKIITM